MADTRGLEEAVLGVLAREKAGSAGRGEAAQQAALLAKLAKRMGTTPVAIARALEGHAVLEVRKVEATRPWGLFRRTVGASGVGLKAPAATVEALNAGAPAPSTQALVARCVAALVAEEPAAQAFDFKGALPERRGPAPSLAPLALGATLRADVARGAGPGEEARAKSQLARLRRPAPGGGFELGERSRAPSAWVALEALLQESPQEFERHLRGEALERWLADDCGQSELADLLTATRLRALAEGLGPGQAKGLFVRLLSYSPLREPVAFGAVPVFVGRLGQGSEAQAAELVAALEALGGEGALEALVKALFEVQAQARPRVLRAMGAVGSPRVLEPLVQIALHSQVGQDRQEAAAAVARIAQRSGGEEARRAILALRESEDEVVKAAVAGALEH